MMNEQALPAILGALSTALVTAVGGLVWMIRQRSNGHNPGNPDGIGPVLSNLNVTLERQTIALEKQMEALRDLSEATRLHNSESKSRHDILTLILQQLRPS